MESPSHLSLRRAFYPCCADDIEEPRRLLAGVAEEIIYCDIRRPRGFRHPKSTDGLPSVSFVQEVSTIMLIRCLLSMSSFIEGTLQEKVAAGCSFSGRSGFLSFPALSG